MQLSVDGMAVEITTRNNEFPTDERDRMQVLLNELAERVRDMPNARLAVSVTRHPNTQVFSVHAKLTLPGLSTTLEETDPYLDSAIQRCLRRVIRRAEAYADRPDREALRAAERRQALESDIIAPESPESGPLAQSVQEGDYKSFRTALAGYEEWLRRRVGRIVELSPAAQERIGDSILIGDIIEETYLIAFEDFGRRPMKTPLHMWLENLVDPAINALLRDPDGEREAVSMARSVRDM